LDRFHDEHREELRARAVESARRDPGYRKNLLKVTEASIMSLKGFSPAKKRQMWDRIRDSQEAVRAMDLNR